MTKVKSSDYYILLGRAVLHRALQATIKYNKTQAALVGVDQEKKDKGMRLAKLVSSCGFSQNITKALLEGFCMVADIPLPDIVADTIKALPWFIHKVKNNSLSSHPFPNGSMVLVWGVNCTAVSPTYIDEYCVYAGEVQQATDAEAEEFITAWTNSNCTKLGQMAAVQLQPTLQLELVMSMKGLL